jgi:hypothetical protein
MVLVILFSAVFGLVFFSMGYFFRWRWLGIGYFVYAVVLLVNLSAKMHC